MSVTEGKENASAQAGLDIFAGAKGEAKASFEIDMMFVEDYVMDAMRDRLETVGERGEKVVSSKEIEAEKLSKWEKLGSAEIGGFVAAGAGITGIFAVGYFDGRLRYQAKIALVVKVGGGTFMKGFVDAKLVGKFILTVAHGLNWKNISDALDRQTELLYHTIMNNCFYLQRTVAEVYGELEDKFKEIMEAIQDLRDLPEKGLEQFKIVDDNWDENVPGYSSFKQYNLAFLVLKSTYYSLKQRNENLSEKEAAIALVEKAQQNKISWNYATWQMKVDLIYDMRHDGSGLLGGLSEEDKEDAVIAVLESSRNRQEFKKIEERLKTPKQGTGREAVFIDDLVDFSQQDRLEYLRNIKYR